MEKLVNKIQKLSAIQDKLSFLCEVNALIKQYMADTTWVGFYLYKNNRLAIGPFQGKVTYPELNLNEGIVGVCFSNKMLLNINDVANFPEYIKVDEDSKSALSLPLIVNKVCIGVLHIESNVYARFTVKDEEYLEKAANIIAAYMMK